MGINTNIAQSRIWTILLIIALLIIGAGIIYMQINKSPENSLASGENKEVVNMPIISENSNNGQSEKEAEDYSSKTYDVNIKNFAFSPLTLTIKKGDKIIWTNQDSAKHTITSDSGNELDSELIGKGESYNKVFNEIGTFEYHCSPHPYMKGRVIVE